MKTIFEVIAVMAAIAAPALTADIRVVIRDERQPEQKQAYANFIGNHLATELGKREGIRVVKSLGLGDVILQETWAAGGWFRSGMVWSVDKGKAFYFRPGHEIFRVYFEPLPLRVLENAVRWMGAH